MIINTDLLLNNPEIIKGLVSGEMTRYGSVIRWTKGVGPHAGNIVKHLAESPSLTNKMMLVGVDPALGSGAIAADIVGHGMNYHKLLGIDKKITGISDNLVKVMGLSQLSAGASILNLGVSAIGFAYMGYKLHQMQKSINVLQSTMTDGFNRVEANLNSLKYKIDSGFSIMIQGLKHLDNRLDNISGQLAYLYLITQDNRKKQEKLAAAVAHLHQTNLIREISLLQAELNDRSRFPDESPRQAIKTASHVRLFLSSEAQKITPEVEAELLLNSDVAIQGWVVATATEANLLMEIGQFQEAKSLLSDEVSKFRQIAERWAFALLNNESPKINTIYRFDSPLFSDYVSQERVQRVLSIYPSEQFLDPAKVQWLKSSVNAEYKTSYASERYNQAWQYKQLAIAEYLDTLSELLARLDTLQDFAQLCQDRGVKSSKELLPDRDAELGLYLLPG
ncbi:MULTISPECIES: hypothetical protein [unclassified Synechocystis]|uniref:hypothetical protein n=1 Tax=unclassified Synechocystis TaxID=2640012 RepID=UPI0004225809|nr:MULTISPECIES: hypothetical protein [unclassified Synechocystis]AIE75009.1 hypothetical protein D082_24810 [Synechocystis sp. PCC 6714]